MVWSQAEMNQFPSLSFRSLSRILRKVLTLKVRKGNMRVAESLYLLNRFSMSEQPLDHPLRISFPLSLIIILEYMTSSPFLVQTELKTLKTLTPSNSSSPSTNAKISCLPQYSDAALQILPIASTLSLFFTKTTSCQTVFSCRYCCMSQQLLSVDASSMMTTLQFVQFWLKIDLRLQQYLKSLALFRVGTTIQKGFSGRVKSWILVSLQYYLVSSLLSYREMCMFQWVCWMLFMERRQLVFSFQSYFKGFWDQASRCMFQILERQCCQRAMSRIELAVSVASAKSLRNCCSFDVSNQFVAFRWVSQLLLAVSSVFISFSSLPKFTTSHINTPITIQYTKCKATLPQPSSLLPTPPPSPLPIYSQISPPFSPSSSDQQFSLIPLILAIIISHMRSQQLDYQTFRRLKAERVKEILREGALVTFRNASYPLPQHFDFDPSYESRVAELLTASKFSLELCDAQGDEIFRFKSGELYRPKPSQNGRIYVSSDRRLSWFGVISGCSYYLARVNPTINAYKGLYSVDNNQYQMQEFTESQHIIKYFRGETKSVKIQPSRQIRFQNQKDFNERQNQAISKCGKNGLTFIKGPPGCGKTRTIARLCKLFLCNKLKVIVGAVSNTGNLSIIRQLVTELSQYNNTTTLEKYYHQYFQTNPAGYYQLLSGFYQQHIKINLVFYPHFQMKEEDLPPIVRLYSYDTQVIKNMIKVSNGINTPYLIQQYRKLKNKETVDKTFYAVFMQAVHITTYEAKIIVATTVRAKSINAKLQQQCMFKPDVAILDQASQSSCSDTLCYLKLDVQRLILVGDEKQLNPTVISNDKLLKQSFFNKFSQKKEEYFTMLDVQYRMHPNISILSNQFFYNFAIKDGVGAGYRISSITPFSNHPVLFINCPHNEHQEIDESSKKIYVNYHEVYIIRTYLQFFPQHQLRNVGIITPYTEQLKLLQKELWKQVTFGLTIKTCDGFQGGEKEYIFVSLVRSNEQGNIGFCGQESRINVSITRARRGMMIVGNYLTFSKSLNYWGLIINHIHTAFSAYFDFTLDIPQADIDRLMAVHRTDESPNKLKAYQQPPQQCYLSYEDYVNEFFKDTPDASEAILQAYYMNYVSQVQNWLYEQQYEQSAKEELEVKASKAPLCLQMLRQDLNKEDSEDEDETERLIRKNKAEAKLLRRLDFLRVGGVAGKTVETYVAEIEAIFQQVPLDYREMSKRMTKQCRKQSLSYLQTSQISPLDSLRELLAKISHKEYSQNHIKGSENVYLIIQWMLMKKLNDSL